MAVTIAANLNNCMAALGLYPVKRPHNWRGRDAKVDPPTINSSISQFYVQNVFNSINIISDEEFCRI